MKEMESRDSQTMVAGWPCIYNTFAPDACSRPRSTSTPVPCRRSISMPTLGQVSTYLVHNGAILPEHSFTKEQKSDNEYKGSCSVTVKLGMVCKFSY